MKNKYTLISVIVAGLILVCFLLSQTRDTATIITMFTVMSATIGPIMGISYPFPLLFKIQYITGLLLSGALFVFGIVKRKKWWGKILIILGILLWIFLGFIGLGTGT